MFFRSRLCIASIIAKFTVIIPSVPFIRSQKKELTLIRKLQSCGVMEINYTLNPRGNFHEAISQQIRSKFAANSRQNRLQTYRGMRSSDIDFAANSQESRKEFYFFVAK